MSETIIEYGQNVKQEALSLTEQAKALKIVTVKDFELSGEFALSLARMKKGLNKYWEKSVGDAKKSYDTLRGLRDADLKLVEDAEEYNTKQRQQFKMEQDRIERVEQERLERVAWEKAEKERQTLLDKAAEMEKLNPKKAEALLEKAEAIVEKPVFVKKVVEKTTIAESGGRITWIKDINVNVEDEKEVCSAIALGHIPVACVEFKNLKQIAKINGWKGRIYGLIITETQRESKRT